MKPLPVAAFLIGAALSFLLALYAGMPALMAALSSVGIAGLLIVTLVHLPVITLLGTAWWRIARRAAHVSLAGFVWARAVRDAAAEALPFSQVGGYMIGARALVLSGAPLQVAGASTLLDLILELAAKLPYVVAGLLLLAWTKRQSAALSAATAIGLCAIGAFFWLQRKSVAWLAWTTARLFTRWPSLAKVQAEAVAAFRQLADRRAEVRASLLLHFAGWMLGAGEAWLLFWLMHRPVGFAPALVIDSLVGALRAVSFFVPAALGVQEGGYILLGALFGVSPGAALALSFIRRARDLLLAMLVLPPWQWLEGRQLPSRFKS